MNAVSLKNLLLILAIFLFIISAADDSGRDWVSFGLAVMAAAFLVSETGWGRNIGGRSSS